MLSALLLSLVLSTSLEALPTGGQHAESKQPAVTPLVSGNYKAQAHASERGEDGTEFWPAFGGFRLKITDTLLVVFTFLLFLATLALYFATRDLVESAEETSRRQLRAYVNVSNARIINIGDPANRVFLIEIKNFGQTPAHDVTFVTGARVAPTPLVDETLLQELDISQSTSREVMAPDVSLSMEARIPTHSAALEARIAGGMSAFYGWGLIRYRDVFGHFHTTKCRYVCEGARLANGAVSPHQNGNEAD